MSGYKTTSRSCGLEPHAWQTSLEYAYSMSKRQTLGNWVNKTFNSQIDNSVVSHLNKLITLPLVLEDSESDEYDQQRIDENRVSANTEWVCLSGDCLIVDSASRAW